MSPAPSSASGSGPEEQPAPPPLRTEARSLGVHWVIDGAVIFLATIVAGFFVGIPWPAVLIASIVLGGCAAPFTRRADERAMIARRQG